MKKDTHKTDMIFRVDFRGNIFALFPHEVYDNKGNVTSYQHVGQHSPACYHTCISRSRPATKDEYIDLYNELENLGYNINIRQKRNHKKFLISYRNLKTN